MERSYSTQEGCPVARTLDIMGDRWTLLVIRDLAIGLTKFSELLESLEGISPNLLADRLKRLERNGIVARSFYSDHPPRAEYKFTEKGRDLIPVVRSLAEWGMKYELGEDAKDYPRLRRALAALSPEAP